jgi:glycine cleavage system H protein
VSTKQKKRKRESDPVTVLRFSDDHLWVRAEADRAQVGISDQGQDAIGEIIAVELPDVGDSIERGEAFGELESVRTVHELIAPVSGTVRAVNGDLEDHPALANEDPYHEGWLIEVDLADETELDNLMATEDYEEFVAGSDED